MTGIGGAKWYGTFCLRFLFLVSISMLLTACDRQPEPIQVGMIASLTGRTADIGVAARDGSLLAIEQVNGSGGVLGQPVELLVRDIANNPDQARLAIKDLASRGVFVSIGPVLSSMAIVMAPLADEAGMLLVSPTVSTNQLSAKDDFFLRVYPQCRDTARALAEYVYRKQHRRMVVIVEQSNKAFTESWQTCFIEKFEQLGGEVVNSAGFVSGENRGFLSLTKNALQTNPDGVLILSSAIDAAMIAQQVAKEKPGLPLFVSEWSFTRDLLAHGGRAVEGVTLFHTFNEQSQRPHYLRFAEVFEQRFGRPPTFPSIHAYDATSLILAGLKLGARSGSALKQQLLQLGEFDALQSTFRLDQFGDVRRPLYLTEVRNGEFVVTSAENR